MGEIAGVSSISLSSLHESQSDRWRYGEVEEGEVMAEGQTRTIDSKQSFLNLHLRPFLSL